VSIRFAKYVETCVSRRKEKRPCPPLRNNKNKNVLLPIKVPQGANSLIQWLLTCVQILDTWTHHQPLSGYLPMNMNKFTKN
jgi:hypothetical protein